MRAGPKTAARVPQSAGSRSKVPGRFVSADYFEVLGLSPAAGRFFLPEEDATRGTHPVAVVSYGLWQDRFAGDRELVGRPIRLNGRPFTVVGVAPRGFQGVDALAAFQVWVPTAVAEALANSPGLFGQILDHRGVSPFDVYGRLRPGVSEAQARHELAAISGRLAEAHPEWNRDRGIHVMPLLEARVNPAFRGAALTAGATLMGAVALVLAIACGVWGRPLLWSLRPPFIPADAVSLDLDVRVLAFTLGVTLVTGVGFALLPALRASRTDVSAALRLRASSGGAGGAGVRQWLVGLQVALSLVALVAAGLFLRSLDNARRIDPGYETAGLALMSLDTASRGLSPERSRSTSEPSPRRVPSSSPRSRRSAASTPSSP